MGASVGIASESFSFAFSIATGIVKGVFQAVCGLKPINLTTNTIKVLGVHFPYNSILKVRNNFLDTIQSIQQVLRFWNRSMLSLEGRIIIFKTLYISNIVYLAFLTIIPSSLIEEIQKIQKTFIWHSSGQNIIHKTILKMVG